MPKFRLGPHRHHHNSFTEDVFDRLLGLQPIDWVERTRKRQKDAEERQEKARKQEEEGRIVGGDVCLRF